ncbi:MAG: LPS export ABC transporter periplasmic protein LptC [Candidatus Marinimicrobia bacterium]|nr:LPS export ABC transporter periplasmic protein LptC [Candidatus Neomarinimicrobiota bacterium]
MRPVILLVLILLFTGCTDFSENQQEPSSVNLPQHESWNSIITLSSQGKNTAIVRSGYMAKYAENKTTYLSDTVKVDFFDRQGRATSHLKALMAEVDEEQNNLLALKNVVVNSDSGVTLYTEKLAWDQKRERILSDTLVTIVTEKDTLQGIGLESNAQLTNWKIFNPVGVTDRKLKKKQ